jgi:hypothetical protein
MAIEDLRTVKQIVEANPGVWTEASVRWLVFNAETNGLDSALFKVGGRVLIDICRFNEWLETHRFNFAPAKANARERGAA